MLFVRRSETSCLKNPGRSTENSVLWKRGNLHYIWQDTLIYERNTWHALLQCRRRTWLTEKSQHVQTRSLLFYPKIPVFWGERENSNKLSVLLYYLFLFLLRLLASFYVLSFLFDLLWGSRASRERDPYRRYSYASPDRFWQKIPTCHDMCSGHFRSLLKMYVEYHTKRQVYVKMWKLKMWPQFVFYFWLNYDSPRTNVFKTPTIFCSLTSQPSAWYIGLSYDHRFIKKRNACTRKKPVWQEGTKLISVLSLRCGSLKGLTWFRQCLLFGFIDQEDKR